MWAENANPIEDLKDFLKKNYPRGAIELKLKRAMISDSDDEYSLIRINPIVKQDYWIIERWSGKLKIGDGVTPWRDLPYTPLTPEMVMRYMIATKNGLH